MDKAGTSDFDEQQDRQGQAAMDEALAHPVVRLFFGVLALAMLVGFVVIYADQVFGPYALWRRAIYAIGTPLVFGPILIELSRITMFGKSRTPWYRALMRRWRSNT